MASTIESLIETPRLRLIRLIGSTEGSQHFEWYHELWTDDACTAWSLSGKCHSRAESQERMTKQLAETDNILYAVFEKSSSSDDDSGGPGKLIGSAGLRLGPDGSKPTLTPPPPSNSNGSTKPLNMRMLGYAFKESAWGKGYATEANKAVIAAYAASVAGEKEKGEVDYYIEAGFAQENPASGKVLRKLGFKEVGWKVEDEPVFLAGKWRYEGYWIYGLYL